VISVRRTLAARPLPAALAGAFLLSLNPAWAAPPAAQEDEEEEPAESEDEAPDDGGPDDSVLQRYHPAPVDGPSLRVPLAPTRIYADAGYGVSDDLSALPYIEGRANNSRFALGGTSRWRNFTFEGELPFLNVTTLTATQLVGGPPAPEDVPQKRYSLGDLRLGVSWARPLVGAEKLIAGFGLRTRIPTHTTKFVFHMPKSMTIVEYGFPYYFHIEPTLLLAGALGRFTFVMNQGALVLAGPNGYVLDIYVDVPTLVFWDAHYAIGYAPFHFLGLSVELETAIQMNHIGGVDFADLNGIRAAWIAPGLQLHFGGLRIDLIGRFGLSRDQELFGVLQYVGTNSFTVRAGWAF
jgi:hypothetical protein